MAAVFFLVTNQTVFSMIDFLGKTSFSFVGKQSQTEELKRLQKIVVGLKLTLAFEVQYLVSIYLVKFGMLFLYSRFAKHTKHITVYLRITQVICLVTFAGCILSLFLSCVPIRTFWSLSNSNGPF
ncbi:hypothetical protein B9Z19DRAFT_1099799 [Tuber borchii]|uniref:Rhodopsin domain-containing protein n=1 Tax=Tuber borchii TaxID=42251 RepID=A0A2T7A0K0_TUBBO|nr:hypothetical protein B9Z19DRAFT_1099799 [Tuber borchii]